MQISKRTLLQTFLDALPCVSCNSMDSYAMQLSSHMDQDAAFIEKDRNEHVRKSSVKRDSKFDQQYFSFL